jgi:hypothetical protein
MRVHASQRDQIVVGGVFNVVCSCFALYRHIDEYILAQK